jgi:hypothetical protein
LLGHLVKATLLATKAAKAAKALLLLGHTEATTKTLLTAEATTKALLTTKAATEAALLLLTAEAAASHW